MSEIVNPLGGDAGGWLPIKLGDNHTSRRKIARAHAGSSMPSD
jgi:hypothetical protein